LNLKRYAFQKTYYNAIIHPPHHILPFTRITNFKISNHFVWRIKDMSKTVNYAHIYFSPINRRNIEDEYCAFSHNSSKDIRKLYVRKE